MEPERWAGVDAGADQLSVCVIDAEGVPLAEADLPNSPDAVTKFLIAAGVRSHDIVAIEAGSTMIHLARKLRVAGFQVRAFDTRQTSKFLNIRQNKTDRNDARGIAEMARFGVHLSDVLIKSVECQKLRTQIAIREQLICTRVRLENAIKAAFRLNGGKLVRSFSATGLRRNVSAELERIEELEGVSLHAEIEPALALCEVARRNVEIWDRMLEKRAASNEVCRRLMTVPGVGPITALSFYTTVQEPFRFRKNEAIGAYLGLAPRTKQSGTMLRRRSISRMGDARTRKYLVTSAARFASQCKEAQLGMWAARLRERRGFHPAHTALARKLAVIMLAIWKSGEEYSHTYQSIPAVNPEACTDTSPDFVCTTYLEASAQMASE